MKPEGTETKNAVLDEALLDRARAGDPAALTALYEGTSLAIYRSIHALLRDEDLVLDVQQDTYLKAFERLDQLREAASFLPWLRRIAVNEARMQLRRKQPLLFSQLSEDGAEEPELPDLRPEASPELALDREETNRLIREILDGLTDAQRLMLGMYYYEQIPVKEIAESLNLSQSTVKTQLRRSRKRVETEVRRLEAQGIKLYGLGPLPFLLALLKGQRPAAGAERAALGGLIPEAGAAAGGAAAGGVGAAAGGTAAGSITVHVGRSFFQTALGRVCLGLLAAAAIGGGALGYGWLQERALIGDVQPPDDPIRIESTLEPPVETDEDLVPTTEPEESVEPESPEDLTEPTEPATEPTESPTDSTETTTEPTGPAEPPIEAGRPAPTQPSAPVAAESEPTQPTPTEPQTTQPQPSESQPPETQPAEPSEEDTPEDLLPAEKRSQIMDWYVNPALISDGQRYSAGIGSEAQLEIKVAGTEIPILYVDNNSVVRLKPSWSQWISYQDNIILYCFPISFVGPGSCVLTCEFDGNTVFEFPIEVSE